MNDRQQFSRRGFVATSAALALGATTVVAQEPEPQKKPEAPVAQPARARCVLLVRHAEKATDDPRDPTLSEGGKLRAAALAKLIGESRLTHVWTSEFKRCKDTASPVAAKFKLVPVEIPARDPAALAGRLKGLPEGSISLVVGHSNTLPALAKAMGAPLSNLAGGTDLRDDEYDRFVVITLGREGETPALLEMRYGA